MKEPPNPVSHPVEVSTIGREGVVVKLEADQRQRDAIARVFGLVAVNAFSAELRAERAASGVVAVSGQVRAEVVGSCVVTLEPVGQRIDEAVSARFVSAAAAPAADPLAEIEVVWDDDAPEPYSGSSIDLGAVAVEHFALALDPYPRAPGAVMPEAEGDAAGSPASPFAVLAKLAKPSDPR